MLIDFMLVSSSDSTEPWSQTDTEQQTEDKSLHKSSTISSYSTVQYSLYMMKTQAFEFHWYFQVWIQNQWVLKYNFFSLSETSFNCNHTHTHKKSYSLCVTFNVWAKKKIEFKGEKEKNKRQSVVTKIFIPRWIWLIITDRSDTHTHTPGMEMSHTRTHRFWGIVWTSRRHNLFPNLLP